MATAPIEQAAALHQETLSDFILVRTDEVDAGDRLRPVDPVWAGALGKMMKRDGQDTPIQVCRLPGRNRWTLVVGAHRHAGAEMEGIPLLRAEVVTAERDARRLREVRENLWRSDLSPIDRAAFIAEAVAIQKRRAGIDPARDGRVASAAARWQKAVKDEARDATVTMTGAYGFTEKVASELGLSGRTIERDLMLFRRLPASIIEELRRHRLPILQNAGQLRALAKLEPGEQAQVVRAMCVAGTGAPKTVAAALAAAKGSWGIAPDPEAKRLSAFIGAYSRMSLPEKKAALQQLAGIAPAGFSIVEGERARPEPAFPAEHVEYREQALAAIDSARELIDGLVEDDVVPGERRDALFRAGNELQLARFTIAGNGFALGGGQ